MDKERLKQIKLDWDYAFESEQKLDPDDMEWLISTVEEQQKEIECFKDEYQVRRVELLEEHIDRLEKQNNRLREALEFYADEYNWHEENTGSPYQPYYESDASKDGGAKARQALKTK